jgi:hypothetical protein
MRLSESSDSDWAGLNTSASDVLYAHFYSLILSAWTSTEYRPSWEANSRSAGQKIQLLLCNPKDNHSVHKSPLMVSILSHMNPVHNLTSC